MRGSDASFTQSELREAAAAITGTAAARAVKDLRKRYSSATYRPTVFGRERFRRDRSVKQRWCALS